MLFEVLADVGGSLFEEASEIWCIFRSWAFTAGVFGVAGAINESNTLRTFLEFMTALLIAGTTMLCEVWQSPRCVLWNAVESCFLGHVCLHLFQCASRFTICCVLWISVVIACFDVIYMWNMSECHFAWRAHLIIIPLPIDQVGLRTTFCSKMGASYKIGVRTPSVGLYKMAAHTFKCVDVKCALRMGLQHLL